MDAFNEITDEKELQKIVKESETSENGPESPSYID